MKFIPRRQPMPIWQKQLWALYLFRSSRNQSAWPLSPLASAVLAIAAHLLPEGLSKGADPISDLIKSRRTLAANYAEWSRRAFWSYFPALRSRREAWWPLHFSPTVFLS
jgi:hypothetical protein